MADSKNILCESIARCRKQLAMTQEELGRRIGVSTQAVSKWECGGMPDPALLPTLADALGTSIDALFGRDGGTYKRIEELLDAELARTPQETRIWRIYELCWAMAQSAMRNEQHYGHSVSHIINAMQLSPEQRENYIPFFRSCEGLWMISISEDRPFFILLPEPAGGYSATLPDTESYERLFAMLARPNRFRVLAYLECVERSFTPGYLASKLSITAEEAEDALLDLTKHAMCVADALDTEAGLTHVYSKRTNLNLLPFLVATNLIMNDQMEYLQFHTRNTPMLCALPGTRNPKAS